MTTGIWCVFSEVDADSIVHRFEDVFVLLVKCFFSSKLVRESGCFVFGHCAGEVGEFYELVIFGIVYCFVS